MFESPLSEYRQKESLSEVRVKGAWKKYGLMSKNFNTPYQRGEYLGTSKEIKIDGSKQKPLKVEYHFWSESE
jgi:hypothetical protein